MKNIHSQTGTKMFSKFAQLIGMITAFTIILSMSPPGAQARILFQDDTFAEVESDSITIGSNDAGAVDTYVTFGADSTASENGVINWNITSNTFELDHTVAITGGLSADGDVDFSAATQMRIRETADVVDGVTLCSDVGEIILDTGENSIYVCTNAGTDTWIQNSATAQVDFDDVYAQSIVNTNLTMEIDNAGGLNFNMTTTGDFNIQDSGGTIASFTDAGLIALTPTSGQDFSATTAGAGDIVLNSADNINVDAATMDVDTTGALSLDAGAASNFTTTAGAITVDGAGGVNIAGNSSEVDVTTTGAFDVNAGAVTVDGSTIDITGTGAGSLDFVGASNVTATSGNLTLSTATSGNVNVTAADAVSITSGSGDDLTLTAADDMIFDDAQLTGTVQLSDVDTDWAAQFTSDGIIDNINDLAAVTANNNITMTFHPEYPDAVVFPDGTANNGTLVSNRDNANNRSYYQWTTNNAALQDIDIRTRIVLPPDFFDVNNFTFEYQTGSATVGDNQIDVTIINVTDSNTTCGTGSDFNSTTWATGTITEATIETGCTGGTALNAGDVVEIVLKLQDNSGAGDFARTGFIRLDYDNAL